MTKKSGYQVTLSLFIEAAPFDAEALSLAKSRIKALPALVEAQDFIVLDVVDKPRNRMEVPESVKVLIAEEAQERAAQGVVTTRITPPSSQVNEALASLHAPKSDEMPPIPPNLDRRRA